MYHEDHCLSEENIFRRAISNQGQSRSARGGLEWGNFHARISRGSCKNREWGYGRETYRGFQEAKQRKERGSHIGMLSARKLPMFRPIVNTRIFMNLMVELVKNR